MTTLRLYQHPLSGHSHRVRMFLSILGLKVEIVDIDLAGGEQKRDEFLELNSFGQVPVLQDGGVTVADSNAILVYLANTYDYSRRWLPSAITAQSEVQRFLSLAAGQVASGPASARLVNVFGAAIDHERAKEVSTQLLVVLNDYLKERTWLVGDEATIADIANYAYLAHAPEGDISLEPYPTVRAWLKRIEDLPGFVPMERTPVGLAA